MPHKLLIFLFMIGGGAVFAQARPGGVGAPGTDAPKPYGVVPTPGQLAWPEMEMYCLIHFGVDTDTDKEWRYGDEDPALVNPVNFDAEQIVAAAKEGGLNGVVVVGKHAGGPCLCLTK